FNGCVNPDPFCDPDSGFCMPCHSDRDCAANPLGNGPFCDETGSCGCIGNADCPPGETCQAGNFFGTCAPTTRCTPDSCDEDLTGYFCDWDSGSCQNPLSASLSPPCITDYDCSYSPKAPGPFCDPVAGCLECRSNADCADLSHSRYFQQF